MKQLKKNPLLVLLCFTIGLVGLIPSTQAQMLNEGAPMGTNLYNIKDYAPVWVFVDIFKEAREWLPQRDGIWDTGETLNLTSDGYPASLAADQWASTLLKRGLGGHYPSGQYTVLYDGDGDVSISKWDAVTTHEEPGKILLDVNPSNLGILLTIRETNPSNPIHNIRVIMPGFEDTYETQIFHPEFLKILEPFSAIRFMDWQRTNFSKVHHWEDRATPATYSQATDQGAALEHMIELCNRTLSDAWFCMPDRADDYYVQEFAKIVRDNLDPRLRVFIEYSNEVWNSAFSQAQRIQGAGVAKWPELNTFEARMRQLSERSVEIFDIFENTFGGLDRLVRVMPSQHANNWTASKALDWNDAYLKTDALATAPYFGGHLGHESKGLNTPNLSVSQVLDFCEQDIQTQRERTDKNKTIASDRGLKLIAYEGGQHMAGFGSYYTNDTVTSLFKAANRHSRMRSIYTQYLNEWKQDGGELFMSFTLMGAVYSKKGCWGVLEFMDDPYTTPKYMGIKDYINGVQPSGPTISSFTASPNKVAPGASTTLNWTTSGATSVTITPDVGSVPVNGSTSVVVNENTLYTLSATNADGTSIDSLIVAIEEADVPVPVINSFSSNVQSVNEGNSFTLSWNVTGSDSVNIAPGIGNVSAVGNVDVVGTTTTTYTLSATNAGGTVQDSTIVSVIELPDAPSFVSQPQNALVAIGQNATFEVSVEGTSPFSYQWQKNNVDIDGAIESSYMTPNASLDDDGSTYRCIVTNSVGTTVSVNAVLTVVEAGARVVDGLIALYSFDEGSGGVVNDTSGNGTPLNLTIDKPQNIDWTDGGMKVKYATIINSAGPADKLNSALKSTNELTVEAWVTPENTSQSGPARIVTISNDTSRRNVTLGQRISAYEGRTRTTTTDSNGLLGVVSDYGHVNLNKEHVVYTRDSSGHSAIFLNGELIAESTGNGDFSNWDDTYRLAIGNELTKNRPWLGEFHMVAIYNRALNLGEVTQNHEATSEPGAEITPPVEDPPVEDPPVVDAPTIIGQPQNQSVEAGQTAQFYVTAEGVGPFTFQWKRDGQDIAGATNYSLFITNVQESDNGAQFTCEVSNEGGSVTSTGAILTIEESNDAGRVTHGLAALYTFEEGAGSVIYDRSNVGEPVNLLIQKGNELAWDDSGLWVGGSTIIASGYSATKVTDAVKESNAVTLEAWITPDTPKQYGPARIVSLSASTSRRNITLGHHYSDYEVRLRTSETGNNGKPPVATTTKVVTGEQQHVVYTRDANGNVSIFIDGVVVAQDVVAGDLQNWDDRFRLIIANEFKRDLFWKGTFHLVALYNQALTQEEVLANYAVGAEVATGEVTPEDTSISKGKNSVQSQDVEYVSFDSEIDGTPTTQLQLQADMADEDDVLTVYVTAPEPIDPLELWTNIDGFDGDVAVSFTYADETTSNDILVSFTPATNWDVNSTVIVTIGGVDSNDNPLSLVTTAYRIHSNEAIAYAPHH
jgi:hypothetical protein